MSREIPAEVLALLEGRHLCVLATAGAAGPHASLMSYLLGDLPGEIMLLTPAHTLKHQNVMIEPRVSLLVDDRQDAAGRRAGDAPSSPEEGRTLQALTVSGLCQPVDDPEERRAWLRRFSAELPQLAGLARRDDVRVLKVRVSHLQLLKGPEQARSWNLEA